MDDRIEEPIRSINPEELQRSLAGYCREKKRDKVHLCIQFATELLKHQAIRRRVTIETEVPGSIAEGIINR